MLPIDCCSLPYAHVTCPIRGLALPRSWSISRLASRRNTSLYAKYSIYGQPLGYSPLQCIAHWLWMVITSIRAASYRSYLLTPPGKCGSQQGGTPISYDVRTVWTGLGCPCGGHIVTFYIRKSVMITTVVNAATEQINNTARTYIVEYQKDIITT